MRDYPHQPLVIYRVEELADIDLHDPLDRFIHDLFPDALQRLVGRAPGPKAVGEVIELLLIDRLQEHRHRTLENLILCRRNADGTSFLSVSLRNVDSLDRRRVVTACLNARQ